MFLASIDSKRTKISNKILRLFLVPQSKCIIFFLAHSQIRKEATSRNRAATNVAATGIRIRATTERRACAAPSLSLHSKTTTTEATPMLLLFHLAAKNGLCAEAVNTHSCALFKCLYMKSPSQVLWLIMLTQYLTRSLQQTLETGLLHIVELK